MPPKPKFRPTAPTQPGRLHDSELSATDDPAGLVPHGSGGHEQVARVPAVGLGRLRGEDAHHVERVLGLCRQVGGLAVGGLYDLYDNTVGFDLADRLILLCRPGDGAGGREDGEGVALGVQQVDGVRGEVQDGGHDGSFLKTKRLRDSPVNG